MTTELNLVAMQLQKYLSRRLGTCSVQSVKSFSRPSGGWTGEQTQGYEVALTFPGNGWMYALENDDPTIAAEENAKLVNALAEAAKELGNSTERKDA